MRRVGVAIAVLVASVVAVQAAPEQKRTYDRDLYEGHLAQVARTLIMDDHPAVMLQMVACWRAFSREKTLIKAQDCYYLHLAAAQIVSGSSQKLGKPVPHEFFTAESVAEHAKLALDVLMVPEKTQPRIIAIWSEATTPKR